MSNCDEFYWLMRGALCIEKSYSEYEQGLPPNPALDAEERHIRRMLGDEAFRLMAYIHSREEGEDTLDWMSRCEALAIAEAEEAMAGMIENEIEELSNEFAD